MIKSFFGVVAEKAVIAMSPKTRPKVPASVASNPDHIKRNGGSVRNIKGGNEGMVGKKVSGYVIQQVLSIL